MPDDLREHLIAIAPELGGLKPHSWISVDLGFSREDFKEILFTQGISLGGDAVTQAPELAFRIIKKFWQKKCPQLAQVSATGRQEILQKILKLRELRNQFPELSRLRRQRGFWRKIDKALQQGRKAFAHASELGVLQERLKERGFENPVRDELKQLSVLYEAFLNSVDLVDEVRSFQLATHALTEALNDPDSAEVFRRFFPKKIYRLSSGRAEALELSFWESVREWVPVENSIHSESLEVLGPFHGEKWHTLDDAAEACADHIATLKEKCPRVAIVIPDLPSVRRTVERALSERGIQKADPRDPQWVKLSEALKKALLPLKLMSSQWRCAEVIEYSHIYLRDKITLGFSEELHARGIIRGLESYQFQKPVSESKRQVDLSWLEPELKIVAQKFHGRLTLEELSLRHLDFLKESELFTESEAITFLESAYTELIAESKHLDQSGSNTKKAPLAVWLEKLERFLETASPPQPRVRPVWGVEIHRLGQIPLQKYGHVSFFGVPASFLEGSDASAGDSFLTDREREVLGTEFSVRSRQDLKQERLRSVRAWAHATRELFIYDAELDWDGRERESLNLFAKQADFQISWNGILGGHPRWLESHRPLKCFQNDRVRLKTELPEVMKATTLDLYSRCPFRALSQTRWNLRDLRESEIDLWADSRGTLLHRAVRLLVERWGDVSAESALEQAWKDIRPRGLIAGARLKSHVKERLLKVIRAFIEKETEYRARVQPQVFSLEGPELRHVSAGVEIRGIPDRIDIVNPIDADSDGFFVLDYKTSSVNPKGREVLSEGYHLQLSFYAVSARKFLQRPVHGLQFVELNKNAGRTKGVFFERFNGSKAKPEGRLTITTKMNQSLMAAEPSEVWDQIEEHIRVRVEQFKEGIYDALPFSKKHETECDACQIDAVCGRARRRAAGIGTSGDDES